MNKFENGFLVDQGITDPTNTLKNLMASSSNENIAIPCDTGITVVYLGDSSNIPAISGLPNFDHQRVIVNTATISIKRANEVRSLQACFSNAEKIVFFEPRDISPTSRLQAEGVSRQYTNSGVGHTTDNLTDAIEKIFATEEA